MPIREEELLEMTGKRPKGAARTRDGGVCRKCGYDLTGLRDGARCPECGGPLSSARTRRYGDQMLDAPRRWLWIYSIGSALLAVSGAGAVAFLIAFAVLRRPVPSWPSGIALAGVVLTGVAWAVGAWIVSGPKPATRKQVGERRTEWRRCRLVARSTQCLWAGGTLWLSGLWATGTWSIPLLATGAGMVAAAAVGACLLMTMMSDNAHWASDPGTGEQLRIASWVFPLAILLLAFIAATGVGTLFGGLLGLIVVAVVGAIFFVVPFVVGIRALWAHASMARWTLLNSVSAELRDLRILEKHERERRAMEAKRQAERRGP